MADFAEALEKLTDVLAPSGLMLPFAGKSIPDGWLLCNGAAVSRTTYADLFAAIGTAWGTGDGSTTFNLPNCDSRFMEGTTDASKVGTYLEAGLPNITGITTLQAADKVGLFAALGHWAHCSGVFSEDSLSGGEKSFLPTGTVCDLTTLPGRQMHFSANTSSGIYSGNTVQPASVQTFMIIKA